MENVESEVEFGLDGIDADRKVEMPLRDALYAYKAIGVFIQFFHQPSHWTRLEDVERFIGTVEEGGLHVLAEAYYQRLRDVWPPDILDAFDAGDFELPTQEIRDANDKPSL